MRRAIIVVIDALGIGALPDADQYGDPPGANTLANVATANAGLKLPHLSLMGLANILPFQGAEQSNSPSASFGRMMEVSRGKDTTTGHWEIVGLALETPFDVYPDGFPQELLNDFMNRAGCEGILGNTPASGTAIIEQFDAEHCETGYPIVYTSADSVFQIACNTAVVPLETLYAWCESARKILDESYNVSRVIARPYKRTERGLERLSGDRRDLAVVPHRPTLLNHIADAGGRVIAIGKIVDIFVGSGITHAIHTHGNAEGIELTKKAIDQTLDLEPLRQPGIDNDKTEFDLIFTNLVDTDALYGHRNDAVGYGKALEEIDRAIPDFLSGLCEDDILIITGDHGCDPTVPGTDHTREYVPLLVYRPLAEANNLGTLDSFSSIAETVSQWLGISTVAAGPQQ
ncbi:MAG: phosphopentomutase [Planctomycetota bacterium]|nr:phosphopentomutase [Planctomycetota bacterium]